MDETLGYWNSYDEGDSLTFYVTLAIVGISAFLGGGPAGKAVIKLVTRVPDIAKFVRILNKARSFAKGRAVAAIQAILDRVYDLATRSTGIQALDQAVDGLSSVLGTVIARSYDLDLKIDDMKEISDILKAVDAESSANALRNVFDSAISTGVTSKGLKVYASLFNALETLPDGLKPKRIFEGTDPNKIAIIGRSMGNRESTPIQVGVNDAATHLQSKGIGVNTFSDQEAWEAFKSYQIEYNGLNGLPIDTYLPNEEVVKTLMFQRNKEWADNLLKQGYTIIDLGDPNGLNVLSPFYAIEKFIVFGD